VWYNHTHQQLDCVSERRFYLLGRVNNKKNIIDYEKGIKKSNELSMAKLNQGLTLNQMQLFAYAIFSTQQDGQTKFNKGEFQKQFEIDHYHTDDAYKDSQRILSLQVSTENLENKKFSFWNVFSSMNYDNGKFSFKWTEDMLPHILDLKEKYNITDIQLKSKFKSSFSWILYDFLKGLYRHWYIEMSKEALMRLFNVEERVSYQKSTAQFKRSVLNVAIEELNQHTELEIWYTEKKIGNKITGFIIHWSSGKKVNAATEKQVVLLREIHNEVEKNMFDYLSLKNVEHLDQARRYIIAVKEIDNKVSKGLSSAEASDAIQEAKQHYLQLENLLEQDGKKRDTSIYYNWLEDIEE